MKDELRAIRAVAFDLDGTLVDSAPDIQRALNSSLRREGRPRFDLDRVRGWIGDGPDALIARALEAGQATIDRAGRVRAASATLCDALGGPGDR